MALNLLETQSEGVPLGLVLRRKGPLAVSLEEIAAPPPTAPLPEALCPYYVKKEWDLDGATLSG